MHGNTALVHQGWAANHKPSHRLPCTSVRLPAGLLRLLPVLNAVLASRPSATPQAAALMHLQLTPCGIHSSGRRTECAKQSAGCSVADTTDVACAWHQRNTHPHFHCNRPSHQWCSTPHMDSTKSANRELYATAARHHMCRCCTPARAKLHEGVVFLHARAELDISTHLTEDVCPASSINILMAYLRLLLFLQQTVCIPQHMPNKRRKLQVTAALPQLCCWPCSAAL